MTPRATYRLQLNRDFPFAAATALVDYFADLGVSHLYLSPVLKARPGSTHGYDIIDHNALNPEIGSEADFAAFSAAAAARGLGVVLDIVPNHMAVGGNDNRWWLDVLEWGRASPYADVFDIDWQASRPDLHGKVLLPVLGDHYGVVLERGEIAVRFDPAEGSFSAWYYDHRFPISPRRYADLLRHADLPRAAGGMELEQLTESFIRLRGGRSGERRQALHEEGTRLKEALAAFAARSPASLAALEGAAAAITGESGDPTSWRPLHALLEAQAYRIAYWRVASDEINYRRFFNINDLAGVRIELPELFERAHRLVLSLVAQKRVHGLRIDHIDGLFDPRGYCAALQAAAATAAGVREGDFYLVVEKILAADEPLRRWAVAGTTGYDFQARLDGLFIDPAGEAPLSRAYERFAGRDMAFDRLLYLAKRRITDVDLASELGMLAREFHALSMSHWLSRDFTRNSMRAALAEVIAHFPVYRTYVTLNGAEPLDRRYIGEAIAAAQAGWGGADSSIFDFLHRVLTGDLAEDSAYDRAAALRLALKFQQLSGPVMAKGAEDTAFYRFNRLIALNEVGADPCRFGTSPVELHALLGERARAWPAAMLAGSTHDTKRGEDARARLALLSEMPREWDRQLVQWTTLNEPHRGLVDGMPAPDPNDEYFFYQTLVGAWPADLAPGDAVGVGELAMRVRATIVKAVREAKERSSWTSPDERYEAALDRFAGGALASGSPFLAEMHGYVASLARAGAINSLAQAAIRLTAPGMPDLYQGAELWDLSMVDPDNRRPVDWARRRRLLAELRRGVGDGPLDRGFLAALAAGWRDGREKLFLVWRALQLRATDPALFASGDYLPLETEGRLGPHLFAFARRHEGRVLVTVAPRLVARLLLNGGSIDWGGATVTLPEGLCWRDALTGGPPRERPRRMPAADLLGSFPVALLVGA